MQWAIALGRIDIMYSTFFLSQYLPASLKVHLSNIQHLYVYSKKYTSTSINFDTETPGHTNIKTIEGNWVNLYAE